MKKVAVLCLLLWGSPATAGTYYVAITGNNSNDGSIGSPFRTIAHAAAQAETDNLASTAATILIQPGTYRESVTLQAETTAALTIQAVTPGTVTMSGADVLTGWSAVCRRNREYARSWTQDWGLAPYPDWWEGNVYLAPVVRRRELVAVDGVLLQPVVSNGLIPGSFYVDDARDEIVMKPPIGVNLFTSTVEVGMRPTILHIVSKSNVTVSGIIFEYGTSLPPNGAVIFDTITNLTLTDNVFRHNSWTGLTLFNIDTATLTDNHMSRNGVVGWDVWKAKDITATGNHTSWNNWRGILGGFTGWTASGAKIMLTHGITLANHVAQGNKTSGLWFDTDCTDVHLDNVKVKNNTYHGVFLEALQGPTLIEDSVFCHNQQTAGLFVANTANVTLTNNQFYRNHGQQILFSGDEAAREFNDWETSTPVSVVSEDWTMSGNTVIGGIEGPNVFNTQLGSTPWDHFVSTLTANMNTYWHSSLTSVFGLSASTVNFAGWQSASGQEASSSFSDPAIDMTCAAEAES